MISNCGHDENGRYSGGKAGDQTSTEWQVRAWYSRPWDAVLRCTNESARQLLAKLARDAAENDMTGYDQGNRYSFWEQLKISGYYPKNIKEPCETDCSAGTLALIKCVGFLLEIPALQAVSIYGYTGNLEAILLATGLFKSLREKKYLDSPDYLLDGDVLLCTGHHVCINLDIGPQAAQGVWYETRITVGQDGLITTTGVNLRMGPSAAYKLLGSVKQGTQLRPSGKTWYQGALWFHCSAGWFSGKYVEGWIQEENGRWWYITEGAKWPAGILQEIGGSTYAFDKSGWMITADRIQPTGAITD